MPKKLPPQPPGFACAEKVATEAGHKRHRRAKEKPCQPCLSARNAYAREHARSPAGKATKAAYFQATKDDPALRAKRQVSRDKWYAKSQSDTVYRAKRNAEVLEYYRWHTENDLFFRARNNERRNKRNAAKRAAQQSAVA